MKQMNYRQGLDIKHIDMLEDFEDSIYQEYEDRRHLRTHMHLKPRKQEPHRRRPQSPRQ